MDRENIELHKSSKEIQELYEVRKANRRTKMRLVEISIEVVSMIVEVVELFLFICITLVSLNECLRLQQCKVDESVLSLAECSSVSFLM